MIANLEQGTIPVLASQMDRCSVVSHSHLVVLSTECLAEAAPTGDGETRGWQNNSKFKFKN
ncbi:MAG: hypothetical protein BRC40_04555 [Cyanobacteria bacterium QH_8_48_120]|nr:MAG: hypothetical protein BRC40_04555 [Cyanobacteria bacterium QH_8_48_120]